MGHSDPTYPYPFFHPCNASNYDGNFDQPFHNPNNYTGHCPLAIVVGVNDLVTVGSNYNNLLMRCIPHFPNHHHLGYFLGRVVDDHPNNQPFSSENHAHFGNHKPHHVKATQHGSSDFVHHTSFPSSHGFRSFASHAAARVFFPIGRISDFVDKLWFATIFVVRFSHRQVTFLSGPSILLVSAHFQILM